MALFSNKNNSLIVVFKYLVLTKWSTAAVCFTYAEKSEWNILQKVGRGKISYWIASSSFRFDFFEGIWNEEYIKNIYYTEV